MSQLVKPPLQVFGLEGRYASALYSAASKQKNLEAVEKELVNLQTAMKTDVKLNDFMMNPTIKRQAKSEALKAISQKLSLSAQSSNLLQALAENGRLKKLGTVINSYRRIMSAHRGEVCTLNLIILSCSILIVYIN